MTIILTMKKPGLLEKFILAYVVFVFVLLGLNMLLLYVSSRLSNLTSEIYLVDYRKKELSSTLIDNIISLEETQKKFMLLQQDSYREMIAQKQQEIDQAWIFLETDFMSYDEKEREQIRNARQLWKTYLERYQKQIDRIPEDPDELEEVFRSNRKEIDVLVEYARASNRNAVKQIDNKIVYLKELGDQTMSSTWWVLAFALSIGLIVPFLIYRSVTRDISHIKGGVKKIAAGDFTYTIPLDSSDELGRLAESFNAMALRLKELDDMKSEFISVVSHELKTPLTSMKEATNLLKEGVAGEISEKQMRLLAIMEEGIRRLLYTVSELLEMSRLESGMVKLNLGSHPINSVVSSFVSEFKPFADTSGVELIVEYLPKDCQVTIDRDKILQVLTNLTHNAIKYSERGSHVKIRLKLSDRVLLTEIEDYGKGIPEEDLSLIFDKFYQSKYTRGHSGIGLGLAISRGIIDAHGGTIYAKSTLNKGSVFTFSLPVAVHPSRMRSH
ncbi:MAG TPA: HAMP domain-containing histidine kinase [Deltaproteobacteria bacterium]|nr:HAMP domain-containing histidine kinase [Deltaproteobacteria bacterium]